LNGLTGMWQGTVTEYAAVEEDADPNVVYFVVADP
jgi:hypothetical protein